MWSNNLRISFLFWLPACCPASFWFCYSGIFSLWFSSAKWLAILPWAKFYRGHSVCDPFMLETIVCSVSDFPFSVHSLSWVFSFMQCMQRSFHLRSCLPPEAAPLTHTHSAFSHFLSFPLPWDHKNCEKCDERQKCAQTQAHKKEHMECSKLHTTWQE